MKISVCGRRRRGSKAGHAALDRMACVIMANLNNRHHDDSLDAPVEEAIQEDIRNKDPRS